MLESVCRSETFQHITKLILYTFSKTATERKTQECNEEFPKYNISEKKINKASRMKKRQIKTCLFGSNAIM